MCRDDRPQTMDSSPTPSRGRWASVCGLAVLAAISGCSSIAGRGPATTVAAHIVFLARPGCPTAVANTFRGGYAVLTSQDSLYTPVEGDILEGPVREGESIFQRYPERRATRDWEDGIQVPIDAVLMEAELVDARRRYDALCSIVADPIPRLPGAPVDG